MLLHGFFFFPFDVFCAFRGGVFPALSLANHGIVWQNIFWYQMHGTLFTRPSLSRHGEFTLIRYAENKVCRKNASRVLHDHLFKEELL